MNFEQYLKNLQEILKKNPELGKLTVVLQHLPTIHTELKKVHIAKGFYDKEEEFFSDEEYHHIEEVNSLMIENLTE